MPEVIASYVKTVFQHVHHSSRLPGIGGAVTWQLEEGGAGECICEWMLSCGLCLLCACNIGSRQGRVGASASEKSVQKVVGLRSVQQG